MQQSSEENPSSRSDTGDPPHQNVVVNTHIKLNIYLSKIKDVRIPQGILIFMSIAVKLKKLIFSPKLIFFQSLTSLTHAKYPDL